MERSLSLDKDSFHSCIEDSPSPPRPPKAQRPKSLYNPSRQFPEDSNNDQLEIDKLQIGSPGKRMSLSPFRSPSPRSSISPQPPLSSSPSYQSPQQQSQWLWKDYPYVRNSASTSPLSQNSYCSYAGSNAHGPPHYLLPPNSGQSAYSSFNNYRSSAVADIFGGRSKPPPSPHPLLSPSRLSPPGGMFGYGAKMNMHCGGVGVYYHHQSSSVGPTMAEIWNLMDNPISRSSSQSSGFISQLELDPDRLTPPSPPSGRNNFQPSIYPDSTAPDPSMYSAQGPYSMMSGSMQVRHRQQQILIGATATSSSIRSRPANTCSRFGPRTSSSSLGKYENTTKEKYEVIFSDDDDDGLYDEEDKESFKTARPGSSTYSLTRGKKNENANGMKNRKIGRSLKSNLFTPRNQIQTYQQQQESIPEISDDEEDDVDYGRFI